VVAGAVKRVQPQERGAGKPGPGPGGGAGAGAGSSGRSSPARTLVKLRVSTEGVVLVPGDAASPPPVRWVLVVTCAVVVAPACWSLLCCTTLCHIHPALRCVCYNRPPRMQLYMKLGILILQLEHNKQG
jgi:hypothetical protein